MNQSLSYEIARVMPLAYAEGQFVSFASFAAPPTTQGPTGNYVGAYVPVASLQNIPCKDDPYSERVISADQKRSLDLIQSSRVRHILLYQNYSAPLFGADAGWQVTVNDPNGVSILYTLLGADQDSQATQTRCHLQRVQT